MRFIVSISMALAAMCSTPLVAQTAPSIAFADAIGKSLTIAQMRALAAPVIVDDPSRRRAQGQLVASYMLCPDITYKAWPTIKAHAFSCNWIHEDSLVRFGRQPRVMFYTKNNRVVTISVVRPFRRYNNTLEGTYRRLCGDMETSPGAIIRAMTGQSGWTLVSSSPDNRWTRGQSKYYFNLLERGNIYADVFTYMWPKNVWGAYQTCEDYWAMSRTVFWTKSFRPQGMKNDWLLRKEE